MTTMNQTRLRPAFTLIELLVVVAIIALLLSILLPSLRCARESAKSAKCGVQLRQFGVGMASYFNENGDWIPGVNTSGFALQKYFGSAQLTKQYLNQPSLPVQPWDWVSPLLRLTMPDLPAVRADRFRLILNTFACPSQVGIQSEIYPFSKNAFLDKADFEKDLNWNSISYLMPSAFQLWGTELYEKISIGPAPNGSPTWAKTFRTNWELNTKKYKSRLSEIGQPSRKIAAADGSRYVDLDSYNNGTLKYALIDHDCSPVPDIFGSFTDPGGWWGGSTAYGVKQGTKNWDGMNMTYDQPSEGKNLPFTYRHGCIDRSTQTESCRDNKGRINALFFDGSVRNMDDRQSRRIDYWYPSGSVVKPNGTAEGMTKVPAQFVLPY